jgi:hypothetical protein
LRNSLQIIVTTHSPVILECVPSNGIIFLERTGNDVKFVPAEKDLIERAFYGQTINKLSVLCEDDTAEYFIRGICDFLCQEMNIVPSDIIIEGNTGKNEFAHHIRALARFNQLDEFIFILDGDAKNEEGELREVAQRSGQSINILFLPGKFPEEYIWERIRDNKSIGKYIALFSVTAPGLFMSMLNKIENIHLSSTDKPKDIKKSMLYDLAQELQVEESDIIRKVGRIEAESKTEPMRSFVNDLRMAILNWRKLTQ